MSWRAVERAPRASQVLTHMTDCPSLPSSSQVTCRQNITGMPLASSLPISSGASPSDFLRSLRCTPSSSPSLNTPLLHSPALPCVSGRKTGFGTCGLCGSPHQTHPCEGRGISHPFISRLWAPLRASWNQCLIEASTSHAQRPPTPARQGWCVWQEGQGGASRRWRKRTAPKFVGWLRGSCKDSFTRKRRKAKAAEKSQEELVENRAHQLRWRGLESETIAPGMNGEQRWRGERWSHRSDWTWGEDLSELSWKWVWRRDNNNTCYFLEHFLYILIYFILMK